MNTALYEFHIYPEPLAHGNPRGCKNWPGSHQSHLHPRLLWWLCDLPDQQNRLRTCTPPNGSTRGLPGGNPARGKSIKIHVQFDIGEPVESPCFLCFLWLSISRTCQLCRHRLFGNPLFLALTAANLRALTDRSRFPIAGTPLKARSGPPIKNRVYTIGVTLRSYCRHHACGLLGIDQKILVLPFFNVNEREAAYLNLYT